MGVWNGEIVIRIIFRLLKLILGVGLLAVLFLKFGLSISMLRDRIEFWELLALTCIIPLSIVPLVSVNRWKLYLALTGISERFWPLWRINLISTFQGLVLPSTQGLDALRMYHIARRHPESSGGAAGSVIVERMIGMLVWCGIAVAGFPFVFPYLESKWPVVFAVAGFAAAAIGGTALVVSPWFHGLYAGRRPKFILLSKVVSFLDATHGTLVNFPYRKVLLSSIGLIVVYQFCSITCVWLLFQAYGVTLPLYMHMAFYPVIAIIAMMPVTIGGFGVREGAFAYFYSLVGVPAEVSVCVSVANYVVLSLLPAALGGVIWLWELVIDRT